MSCLVTLSQKELHRLEAVQKIRERRLTVTQAAELLRLSRSQVHRLLQAYDRGGADGLASKERGRPSNRRHTVILLRPDGLINEAFARKSG
jgi:transposase